MIAGSFLRAPRGWGAAPAYPPVTGTKAFVDEALPAGVECVQYSVQSQRGVKLSPVSATLVVNIGKAAALAGKPTSGTRAGKSQNSDTSRSQNAALGMGRGVLRRGGVLPANV